MKCKIEIEIDCEDVNGTINYTAMRDHLHSMAHDITSRAEDVIGDTYNTIVYTDWEVPHPVKVTSYIAVENDA